MLLNGLDKKQIHIIEAEEQGKRTVRNPEQDIIGLGAEGILLDVFGLESTFDTKTIKRLARYQDLTRQRILDQLSEAEECSKNNFRF